MIVYARSAMPSPLGRVPRRGGRGAAAKGGAMCPGFAGTQRYDGIDSRTPLQSKTEDFSQLLHVEKPLAGGGLVRPADAKMIKLNDKYAKWRKLGNRSYVLKA